MKYFVRIVLIIILLIITCFFVTEYALSETTQLEQSVYEETINISTINKVSSIDEDNENEQIDEDDTKIDISKLLESYEKFDTEYETENGEKYTIIGTVRIPKIGVEHDIFSTTSETLLNMSINRYWEPNPNETGNMCLIGHNYNDSKFFANLYKLNIGDKIEITDACGKTLNYTIYDKFVADPYDTSCTSQLTDGQTEVTLITCHNYGRTRLILKARAQENENSNIIRDIINYILKQ